MKEKAGLKSRLDEIIIRMKKVTGQISDDGQPASARELEELTSLGSEYGEIVTRLAVLENTDKKINSKV